MPYGNEGFLGMPVYGRLPLNIPLSMLWALAWVVWWGVYFWVLRRGYSKLSRLCSFVIYVGLGIAVCRTEFLVIPLRAWYLELFLTVAVASLAPVIVGAVLKPVDREVRRKLIVGIPALTLPILMGVYAFAIEGENQALYQTAVELPSVRRLVVKYHERTGEYPSEREWQEKIAPYSMFTVESERIRCGRWRDLRYHKPESDSSGDQIIVSVVVEAGQVVPAQRVSITLDGRVTKERIR